MLYLITVVFFLIILFGVFVRYDSELTSIKKRLALVNKQNRILKGKLNAHVERIRDFKMETSSPVSSKGIITKETSMRISPLSKSIPLNTLKAKDVVHVITEAEVSDTKWFEIRISSKDNTNNLGWIKNDSLSLIDNSFDEAHF